MDRLANLLGVTALTATDRLRSAVERELAHGGSAPAALVHLQAYPGESVERLRRVLGVSQPAAVRVVDRLVAEGLVERRSGPDRRTLALHATAAGERAASELLSRRTQSLRSMLEVLAPDEQAALEPLLGRLVAALADDRPQALRVCRLCDRQACTSAPGCPLDHTTETRR
ncbi:MAG: MarR family winged helix-turn-helix transcriptional regulator [Solirubrobacteraceae bacterium]